MNNNQMNSNMDNNANQLNNNSFMNNIQPNNNTNMMNNVQPNNNINTMNNVQPNNNINTMNNVQPNNNINMMNNVQPNNNINMTNNIQPNNNQNMMNSIQPNNNQNMMNNVQPNNNISNNYNKDQQTMYTEWNSNKDNNKNDSKNPNLEEKPYLVLSDEEIKKGKKNNNILMFFGYGMFVIVGAIVFYMYQVDKYEFYPVKNEVLIANKSTYQVELTPKSAENFDYLNYKYEIEDKSIAEVNEYGEITTKGVGETNLRIRYKNAFNYKTVKIKTEDIDVEKIEVKDETGGKLQKGESVEITPIINNNEEIHKDLECRSSDESVLLIGEDCRTITPVEEGEASIIIEDEEGEESEEIEYTVEKEETETERIELSESKITIKVGTKSKIEARIYPEEVENNNLKYACNNENVEVDQEGNIYGKKIGTSIITIMSGNGIIAYCTVTVEDTDIQIDSIKIKESEKELKIGESYQLGVEIVPSNATNREVTWTSSNSNIATVTNGKIIGKAVGEVNITAKTTNGKTSVSKIKVIPDVIQVDRIDLKENNVVIEKGSKYIIGATIVPSNATNKRITYTSSNSKVSVDATGVAYGKEIGKSVITATSTNGKKNTVEIEVVNQKIEPSKITMRETQKELKVGDSGDLIVNIEPSNATVRTIKWTSSNKNVVSVVNGKIVGHSGGEAEITATSLNGLVAKCKVIVKVPVKSIVLSGESQVKINTSIQYNAAINPTNASDQSITWSSSNPSVASVDAKGLVTAKKAGTTVLKAQTKNGVYGEKTITITNAAIAVKEVKINPEAVTITENKTVALSASINPSNATDQSITWTSSNTKVATVTSGGQVKGIAAGEAIITAKTKNGVQGTRKVTVTKAEVAVTQVSLNITNRTIYNGETIDLKATIAPANASNKSIKWTSTDANIAKVDQNGKVVAGTKVGTATVTATSSNGKVAKCTVLVKAKPKDVLATGITLNVTDKTLNIGESVNITGTIKPDNTTNKNISWTSSNTNIATVSNGKVTAKKAGSVTITAKTSNGKAATCKITVKDNSTSNVLNPIKPSGTLKYSAESNTLKVYIKDEGKFYASYIWAKDPVNQLKKQYQKAAHLKTIFENTIKNNNLKNKIVIGFNNNYSPDVLNQKNLSKCPECKNTESLPLVISNGKIVANHCDDDGFYYRMAYIDGNNILHSTGKLNQYSVEERKKICKDIINSGAKNTFIAHKRQYLIENYNIVDPYYKDNENYMKQYFCQINENNYVLLSSKSGEKNYITTKKADDYLKKIGCKTAVSFDSGRSTNTYLKKAGTTKVTTVTSCDSDRKLREVLYFTELD